jgi:hypothetical protein
LKKKKRERAVHSEPTWKPMPQEHKLDLTTWAPKGPGPQGHGSIHKPVTIPREDKQDHQEGGKEKVGKSSIRFKCCFQSGREISFKFHMLSHSET